MTDKISIEEGLKAMLTPGIVECDQSIQHVLESQALLRTQIDRLTAKLNAVDNTVAKKTKDNKADDDRTASEQQQQQQQQHIDLTAYTNKLTSAHQRLDKTMVRLRKVAERLENIRTLVRRHEPPPPQTTATDT